MIAKFIASPPFYCPRIGDPWGFALLCKGAAWLRPAFPLGVRILRWRLLYGVFTATSSLALPLICQSACGSLAMGGELDDTCLAMSRLLSEDGTRVCRQVGNTSPGTACRFKINLSYGFIQLVKPQLA